jgi:toxin-antitoxin system PIN domain toxin
VVLPDVNVLVYSFRADAGDHARYRAWLDTTVNGDAAFGLADLVLSGFLRVVTHPSVFKTPTPMADALRFVEVIRGVPNAIVVAPGPRHFDIFTGLCRLTGVRGNLVPDAYLAALAIESGSDWVTVDKDFARFPGLRCRHPLD